MERKINSECKFDGLKDDRLIYRCREFKEEEWERSTDELIRYFPSIY